MSQITVTSGSSVLVAAGPSADVSTGMGQTSADDYRAQSVLVKNLTGTQRVYLGKTAGEAVAATGWPWDPADGPMVVELEPTESLYARSAGADQDLRTLNMGR